MSNKFVERARALVGTRFRPQGRSAETGLDCVGLVLEVFGIPAAAVRRDYRLRGDHGRELKTQIMRFFRPVAKAVAKPGDLILSGIADDQLHLAVCTEIGFVHADARLGQVVETPGRPQWRCAGTFRRRTRSGDR